MTGEQTVYVGRGPKTRVYHVHPECSYLPSDPAQYREADRDAIAPHYTKCSICEDKDPVAGWDHGCGDKDLHDALLDAEIDPFAHLER